MRAVLSYGGGLDSFAMLLLALERGDQLDAVAFVDVSDGTAPGEWPGTYRHIREVAMPLCARAGIPFVTISAATGYPVRDATSLFGWMRDRGQIPVAGPNRICTRVAKVERFERWMDDMFPRELVEVWIGFEAGEEARAEKDPNAGSKPAKRKKNPAAAIRGNRFPLIEADMCRCRCRALVESYALPVPRKSACVFCPYASMTDWQTFARELPDQFAEVAELERVKPPTKAGHKLSIMGYRTHRDRVTGEIVKVEAPPISEWIRRKPRGSRSSCSVCGAAERATKATGCGFLSEATAAAPPKQIPLLPA